VLSVAKIAPARWRYYQQTVTRELAAYYTGRGEAVGRWYGDGLAHLGLATGAEVSEPQLEALFGRALHPGTGERLGRAWRADGVTGFDVTLSAPKSASVLYALGGEVVAKQVAAAHVRAVAGALAYLQEHAAYSRRGVDGIEQVGSAGLTAALFTHRSSRAGDPQLHTHALVLNKVLSSDGSWRALDGHEIYHQQKAAGAIYQAGIRAELTRRLGVSFGEPNAHGQAEIAGIPQRLLRAFSKRTDQITAEAEPHIAEYETTLGRKLTSGERTAVTKTAVLTTRPGKEHTGETALFDRWQTEATRHGADREVLLRGVHQAARTAQPYGMANPQQLAVRAVQSAGQRRAAFSAADLTVEVAARMPTAGNAEQTRRHAEQLTKAGLDTAEARPLGAPREGITARRSDPRYATAELLAAEKALLERAELRAAGRVLIDPQITARCAEAAGLDAEQAEAVRRLTAGEGLLTVLVAPAGAGKTTVLGATAAAYRQAGFDVVGLAPSARAAAELAPATGAPADTLAKWEHETSRTEADGRPARPVWLDYRSVIMVDEASMANTFTLDRLTGAAQQFGVPVILVGDPAQIGVVEGPGGALEALTRKAVTVQLPGVRRFRHAWERQASLALRAGTPDALDPYAEHERIHPAGDGGQALDAAFAHWQRERAAGRDALLIARARVDVDALNARARAAAQAAGQLRGRAVWLGERDWQAGDLLLARRNDRHIGVGKAHVRNGERYRVISVHRGALFVKQADGTGRAMLPANYVEQHADYGWAATVDTAQGATADVAVLLARPGLDREHLYVGMTRGRAENHVYVAPDPAEDTDHYRSAGDDPAPAARRALTAALARSGAQQAAHTVAEQAAEQDSAIPLPDDERARIKMEYAARRLDADRLRQTLRWHEFDVARYETNYTQIPRWRPRERRHAERLLDDVHARREGTRTQLDDLDHQLSDMQATLARPRPVPPPRHTTILGPERWQPSETSARRADRVRQSARWTPPTPRRVLRPAYVDDDHDELHRALTRQDDHHPGRDFGR
jgi:conjugative relaxase-like TrwC/TraI family protein